MVLKQSSRVEPLKSTIPATLTEQGVVVFWLAVLLTGIGAGISAAVLTLILQWVQHVAWPGPGGTLLDSVEQAGPWRHIAVLVVAGLITGAGQLALVRLTSANGIEITTAIWFDAGRLPALRTLGSAILSVLTVGMGASLGREGAPRGAAEITARDQDVAGLHVLGEIRIDGFQDKRGHLLGSLEHNMRGGDHVGRDVITELPASPLKDQLCRHQK